MRASKALLVLILSLFVATVFACGTDGASTFGGGNGLDGGGDGSNVPGFTPGFGDNPPNPPGAKPIHIEPPTATLAITGAASAKTQAFVAKAEGSDAPVSATWTLDDYTAGAINGTGTFTAKGNVAATLKVTASYGGATATATLTITISTKEDLGDVTLPDGTVIAQSAAGISGPNRAALDGTPTAEGTGDPTTKTQIVYPYDNTVMPRGLIAPVPQFTGGTHPPEDFKVILDTTGYHWEGYGHVPTVGLEAGMPQAAWDGALLSALPDSTTQKRVVTITIIKASGGVAYGPATTNIIVAPASLTGIVYYSSYSQDQLVMNGSGGGDDFGLWSVRPGTTDAPSHLNSGCVICHAVSANGKVLTTGSDESKDDQGGVFQTDGTTITRKAFSPTTLGGDTRHFSWAVPSPDGAYVLRGINNFWGGSDLTAWKTPDFASVTTPAVLSDTVPIDGDGKDIKGFVHSFSVDGKKLVYINSESGLGAPSKSVSIVDVSIAAADVVNPNGKITLSNPRTVFDSTASGVSPASYYTKVPMFLPDSENIVLQETSNSVGAQNANFNQMLPNWAGAAHSYFPGALYMLHSLGAGAYENIELTNANTGSQGGYSTMNFEPKPLPVQAGGYFWIVFTSIRSDGLNGPPIKKLWVAAISPDSAQGIDPSHPPFLLTNQSIVPTQECERGYWSVEPCHSDGATCATGDDCCNGFCRPQDDNDPSSQLVCKKPTTVTCANTGDRCRAGHSEDCCNAQSGVVCIGSLGGFGTCAVPGVN